MKSAAALSLAVLVAFPGAAPAQQEALIHARIQQVYDFQPHLLNPQQMAEKSRVLDRFWVRAEEEPERYAAALRQELGDVSNPSFFFYDGSMLLLSLSDAPDDRKAAAAAVARCDLRDVKP